RIAKFLRRLSWRHRKTFEARCEALEMHVQEERCAVRDAYRFENAVAGEESPVIGRDLHIRPRHQTAIPHRPWTCSHGIRTSTEASASRSARPLARVS